MRRQPNPGIQPTACGPAAFGLLAALHVFWAFGGTWGAGAAVAPPIFPMLRKAR